MRGGMRDGGMRSSGRPSRKQFRIPHPASRIPHPLSLLYIATQIKLAPRLRDDAIEAGFYFRGQIFSPEQALGFATNRLQRLDEVAALQFSGIVGHWRR